MTDFFQRIVFGLFFFFFQISGLFAFVMVGELLDDWNRDKMSEPPPVYNHMIFPDWRNTANEKNNETQTLSLAQGWNSPLIQIIPFFHFLSPER